MLRKKGAQYTGLHTQKVYIHSGTCCPKRCTPNLSTLAMGNVHEVVTPGWNTSIHVMKCLVKEEVPE